MRKLINIMMITGVLVPVFHPPPQTPQVNERLYVCHVSRWAWPDVDEYEVYCVVDGDEEEARGVIWRVFADYVDITNFYCLHSSLESYNANMKALNKLRQKEEPSLETLLEIWDARP